MNRRLTFLLLASSLALAATASAQPPAPAPAAPQAKKDVTSIHAGVVKPEEAGDVRVPKATGPNARTVGEIMSKPAALKDKPVVVRGKVVKYTPGVMGKNWIHLRDGTGLAADNTHDITVTTMDEAKKGDVVIVSGVVRLDKDLGSGYFYKVLLEDAKLGK